MSSRLPSNFAFFRFSSCEKPRGSQYLRKIGSTAGRTWRASRLDGLRVRRHRKPENSSQCKNNHEAQSLLALHTSLPWASAVRLVIPPRSSPACLRKPQMRVRKNCHDLLSKPGRDTNAAYSHLSSAKACRLESPNSVTIDVTIAVKSGLHTSSGQCIMKERPVSDG